MSVLVIFIYLNIAFFIAAFIPIITQSNVIADTFMTVGCSPFGITERRAAFGIDMLKVNANAVILANLLIQLNDYAGIIIAGVLQQLRFSVGIFKFIFASAFFGRRNNKA